MLWSLVALAISVAVLLVALLRQRLIVTDRSPSERSTRSPGEEEDRAPESTGGVEAAAPIHSCPVCLSEYAPDKRYCVRDGALLVEGCASGSFSQGMICPTCRRGYPSDASFCPEDADELVPYGLYGAASATRSPIRLDAHKICPECGVRHAAAHVFCGQDGTELVVVN